MTKKKVAIIGLGLMGGSLGAALVRSGYPVNGWDNDSEAVTAAVRIGAVTGGAGSLREAVVGAEVIFIATPVTTIAATIRGCLADVVPGAVFSDLGSIKERVIEEVFAFLPDNIFFVPGHPMTGSDQHGIAAADPFLFENAAYIIIDEPRAPEDAKNKVKEVLAATGAYLIGLTAADHDRIVGTVSHLPHLIAATLARTVGAEEEKRPGTMALAAGGFRDTTRIAAGSPGLWEEIINGNRGPVLAAIDLFETQLCQLKATIAEGDRPALRRFLTRARETRLQVPAKNKGFLSLLFEMVVTITDHPGAIQEVLQHLSQAGINIKDIEILRIREGDGGTLRLALENDRAVTDAVNLLEKAGFKARRR